MFRLLSGLDRSLATMYKVAIDLMAELPEPGEERARLSSVGHCVREILNNLPEALNDVEGVPPRGHDDGASSRRLARAVETTLAAASGVGANGGDDEVQSVSIPVSLVEAMAAFASEHQEVAKRVARRDSATVLGWIDPTNPALLPWTAARAFFMGRTHLSLGHTTKTSPLPSDNDVIIHLENIEASLRARLGAFYDTIHSLDDLLAEANQQHAVRSADSR